MEIHEKQGVQQFLLELTHTLFLLVRFVINS